MQQRNIGTGLARTIRIQMCIQQFKKPKGSSKV